MLWLLFITLCGSAFAVCFTLVQLFTLQYSALVNWNQCTCSHFLCVCVVLVQNRTKSRTNNDYMQLIPIPMLLWNSKRIFMHDGDVRSNSNHRWENHIELYLQYKLSVFSSHFCINHNNWIIVYIYIYMCLYATTIVINCKFYNTWITFCVYVMEWFNTIH